MLEYKDGQTIMTCACAIHDVNLNRGNRLKMNSLIYNVLCSCYVPSCMYISEFVGICSSNC